jgi:hypothetical protein
MLQYTSLPPRTLKPHGQSIINHQDRYVLLSNLAIQSKYFQEFIIYSHFQQRTAFFIKLLTILKLLLMVKTIGKINIFSVLSTFFLIREI